MRNPFTKHGDRGLERSKSFNGESTAVNVLNVTEERDGRALSLHSQGLRSRSRVKNVGVITHELSRFTGSKRLCLMPDRAIADIRHSKILQPLSPHSSCMPGGDLTLCVRQL